jgi:probable phosphoglycerate mutase
MARLFFVRHGTTAWNQQGRLQGWADVPLSETGRRQAVYVGRAIAATAAPERVVTSPLRRAVETARVVAGRVDAGIDLDPGWKERSFGSLEGQPAAAALEAHPELHPKSGAFSATASLDGESCRAVVARIRECWRSLPRVDEPLVVVTHETPIRVVTGLVDGETPIEAIRRRSFEPGIAIEIERPIDGDETGWTVLRSPRIEGEGDE